MKEESKQILISATRFFDDLQKRDQTGTAVFPESSLPYSKEKIKEVIKERIQYKNQDGQDFKSERKFLENYYTYLSNFVPDPEAEFLNKIFLSLSEDYRSSELTDENFESKFHKIMNKIDFQRYRLGMIGRNARRIVLEEEIKNS